MRARRGLRLVAMAMVVSVVASGCGLIGGGGGTYKLIAYFPRAVSVYPSSQVRVLGLPGGTVDKVEVVGTEVKVTMSMQNGVPVPKNVKALIAPQSLIGERYIHLSPAWRQGEEKATDGMEIRDTIIPVEPDEALAELKKFLDSLDPNGLGRLINNAADDLQGQGQTLNHALDQVSTLVSTFAAKDTQLANIVDHFDKFTATLTTRETQLGEVLTTFSQATQVLADERQSLENLLAGLADLSRNGLQLVSTHASRLRTDLETLTRLTQSISVNLDGLEALLDSTPLLVKGIHGENGNGSGAYNAPLRAVNLRQNFGPVALAAMAPIIQTLKDNGVLPPDFDAPTPCVPGLQTCPPPVITLGGSAPVVVSAATATTPIDDLLGLLGAPTVAAAPPPSTADRIADGVSAIGGFFGDCAGALVGAS